jgi:hypothetical protein
MDQPSDHMDQPSDHMDQPSDHSVTAKGDPR